MNRTLNDLCAALIRSLSALPEVTSAGKSGGPGLPADGGDIDLYVFCEKVPAPEARQALVRGLGPNISPVMFSEHGLCERK